MRNYLISISTLFTLQPTFCQEIPDKKISLGTEVEIKLFSMGYLNCDVTANLKTNFTSSFRLGIGKDLWSEFGKANFNAELTALFGEKKIKTEIGIGHIYSLGNLTHSKTEYVNETNSAGITYLMNYQYSYTRNAVIPRIGIKYQPSSKELFLRLAFAPLFIYESNKIDDYGDPYSYKNAEFINWKRNSTNTIAEFHFWLSFGASVGFSF